MAKRTPKAAVALTAKGRLDRLIAKGRPHLYKPIQIAEILFHDRADGGLDFGSFDLYRHKSTGWRNAVCPRLLGKPPVLNSRYEDQLFDPAVLPPEAVAELARTNRDVPGLVEPYIYAQLRQRFAAVADVRQLMVAGEGAAFDLTEFLAHFDRPALRRSVDKAYEVVVYALFDSITRFTGATVTLRIDPGKADVLRDFRRFVALVMGIDDVDHPEVSQPARLYRVGTTNAADAGLDMWANFGPAIQIKHISLSEEQTADIVEGLTADRVVVVCRQAEADVIENVMAQIGMRGRIQGFITEPDLIEWYALCRSEKYATTLGQELLAELAKQFDAEFPLGTLDAINTFFAERGYDASCLTGEWAIDTSAGVGG